MKRESYVHVSVFVLIHVNRTCAFDGIPTTFCSVLSFSDFDKNFVKIRDTKTRTPSASSEGVWFINTDTAGVKIYSDYMIPSRRKRNKRNDAARDQNPNRNIMQGQGGTEEKKSEEEELARHGKRYFFSPSYLRLGHTGHHRISVAKYTGGARHRHHHHRPSSQAFSPCSLTHCE